MSDLSTSLTLELDGVFKLTHPEMAIPVVCRHYLFHWQGDAETGSLRTTFQFSRGSLGQLAAHFPVTRDHDTYDFVMRESVLAPLRAAYARSQTAEDFLKVDNGACLLLQNYLFKAPSHLPAVD